MIQETILLVDDEVKVLSSLSRELFEEDANEVLTAKDGVEALATLKSHPNVAVILSDYHMPGMNGIEFFEAARTITPNASRIILTGAGDLSMAIDAVNRGSIFRFLLKPCPPDLLISTIKEGVRQYRLVTGEKELLSKTLSGSVKMMTDILSVVNPELFAQSTRLRMLAHRMVEALKIEDQPWEIEIAALLCRIGAVTIPHAVVEKWQSGAPFNDEELTIVRSIPRIGRQLIQNIPRLENIAEAVGYQDCHYSRRLYPDAPMGDQIPYIARILKIIVDYDRFSVKMQTPEGAVLMMEKRESEYDPRLFSEFRTKVLKLGSLPQEAASTDDRIAIRDLQEGMVLARDLVDRNGLLIIPAGTIINEVLKYRLINFYRTGALINPIFIVSENGDQ